MILLITVLVCGAVLGAGAGLYIRGRYEAEVQAELGRVVEKYFDEAQRLKRSLSNVEEACNLHIQEIKRLEALRDELQQTINNHHRKASEAARKGQATRKARKMGVAA